MNNELKQKYLEFLSTLKIEDWVCWLAVDSKTYSIHTGGIVGYDVKPVLGDYCWLFAEKSKYSTNWKYIAFLPKDITEDFPWKESLIHISELENFKRNKQMRLTTAEEVLHAIEDGETVIQRDFCGWYWVVEGKEIWVVMPPIGLGFKHEMKPAELTLETILKDTDRLETFSLGVLEERVGPKTQKEYDTLASKAKEWIKSILPDVNLHCSSYGVSWFAIGTHREGQLQLYATKPKEDRSNHIYDWDSVGYLTVHSLEKPNAFPDYVPGFTFSISLEEVERELKQNQAQEMKMEKFTFVRDVTTVGEALIALGEGLYISTNDYVTSGYYLKGDKVVGIYSGDDTYAIAHIKAELESGCPMKAFKKEKEEWFHNIPECGILCWVWSADKKSAIPATVIGYDEQRGLKFKTPGYYAMYAEPMTFEEVKKFILPPN